MNKKTLLILLLIIGNHIYSQTFSLVSISYPTCYGNCDGVAVFDPTTAVTGPFTAVISNTSGCPNSTVQSSSTNTISIGGICPCVGTYSVNFYDVNSILVGYELLQVPITSTSALVLQTPTVDPAVCSTCCEGSVYVAYSGGYESPPNNATVTLDGNNVIGSYFPIDSVCVGQHTVCVKDLANCIVCNTFSMNFVPHVGINELNAAQKFSMSPNPANDILIIRSLTNEAISEIRLMDMNGKTYLLKSNSSGSSLQKEFDLTEIATGVYIVEMGSAENFTHQKLVKLR